MNPHAEHSSSKSDSDSDSVTSILSTSNLLPKTTTILRDDLWGDPCIDLPPQHNDILRLYCQNVNGIFDPHGIGMDDAFHTMQTLGADIFTFNETHGDDTNPQSKMVIRRSET